MPMHAWAFLTVTSPAPAFLLPSVVNVLAFRCVAAGAFKVQKHQHFMIEFTNGTGRERIVKL
ncbi:MAG: hypothetical protein HC896_06375 [Bacteroidales bacterium]|nr:hypothetical protein [Bacteroidales bacterium]